MNTPLNTHRFPGLAHTFQPLGMALGLMVTLGGWGTGAIAQTLTPQDLPRTVTGQTGGNQATANCGTIDTLPAVELRLTSPSYLKLQVASGGDPTLYIEGPLNLCVLYDKTAPQGLTTSGRWPAGDYRVFVGEKGGFSNPYTLTIQGSDQ